MILEKLEVHNQSDLDFFEKLYLESFPIDERRPLSKVKHLVENQDNYDIFIALDENGQKVGFITQWNLDSIFFLEHFAVSPNFRNGGYGKVILKTLIEKSILPFVGEIELPETSDMAARRKSFYERVGFKVWDVDYEQPPLDVGQNSIPLLLITYGDQSFEINEIKKKLYSEVYRLDI